jgi:4-amino-4-deoxy-L-arabinose transferase-like glycosyltransferase
MTRNRTFNIFFIIILLVNLTGIFNRIFVADSALYAAISKNMLLTNNWWELFVNGNDWLDKPHFQFWLCALSMKIFGVNAIAYKLPSFLSFLLALVYIYRFSVKIYSKEVGLVALLVFSSALHIIVSNNDVRAEAIMLPLMIAGIYHFYFLGYTNKLRDLFLGALFTAAAIMTKGIFILIPIAGGILADIVLKKRWDMLFRWRWLWGFK